jgi:hypothetical protein
VSASSSPSPSSSSARNDPEIAGGLLSPGPRASVAPPPYKGQLRPSLNPNPNPRSRHRRPSTTPALLRRPAPPAPPRIPRSGALQLQPKAVVAPPCHPGASRAQQLGLTPLHRQESVTRLPPVSRSAPAILHRRWSPNSPNPFGAFTGPPRINPR